jgi:hypothetical protein
MDAETGERILLDTHDPRVRRAFSYFGANERETRTQRFRQMHANAIDVRTDQSYVDALVKFFKQRERRMAL